jgi:osmotically-inducible protein OsmY
MKYLYKLAFIVVFGAGFCLAQTGTTGQNPASTPPTFPSGQQSGAQTTNPDQTSPMGQTGTTSTTAITKAQSDIQMALRKQLPASADSVTVGVSDDNKIELTGTVNSDAEKKQIEQVAQAAAPDQKIKNKLKVNGENTPRAGGGNGTSATSPESGPPTNLEKNQNPYPNQAPTESQPTDKTRRESVPPPMAMGFAQSQQQPGTEDKGQNQSGTTGQSNSTPMSSQSSNSQDMGNSGTKSAAGASDAQSNIQKAWQQDPTLANANITASVNGNKIELTGTVADKEQRKTAKRIAESNAGGFKVVDHIKVQSGNENKTNSSNPTKY